MPFKKEMKPNQDIAGILKVGLRLFYELSKIIDRELC